MGNEVESLDVAEDQVLENDQVVTDEFVQDGDVVDEAVEPEIIVTIGGEAPPVEEDHAQAPEWVRELRKNHRELQRKNRELEERLKSSVPEVKPLALGPKPTLEELDYDAEKYEQSLSNWYENKRKVDEQNAKVEAENKAANDAWQNKLSLYNKAKVDLKVKDFDEAETLIQECLSPVQQGIIVKGCKNSALVVYALGKNEKKLKELASITDPVEYAFAVATLETQLKMTEKKSAPPPEKSIRGTGSVSGTVDSTLERLRTEAAKTGDYTKVTQYKRSKRQ